MYINNSKYGIGKQHAKPRQMSVKLRLQLKPKILFKVYPSNFVVKLNAQNHSKPRGPDQLFSENRKMAENIR